MTAILVTGANGFVGRALCTLMADHGHQVKAAIRTLEGQIGLDKRALPVIIGDIHATTDWQAALLGIEVVIHLAARVHVMHETATDAAQAFRRVNTDGTENLARQAAAAGIKRFIFLSSVKVLGESTEGKIFGHQSPATPKDPYASSKWAAEQALQALSTTTGMQVVIIRTPLVYGAGVKGNFLRLMQLIKKGWPLPFGRIRNKRSMVYVENLCALLQLCVNHPAAAGQTLLCADTDHFATPELIRQLARELDTPARLWPIPASLLKGLAGLLGKRAEMSRLCDSLQVDAAYTFQLLNWQPPYSVTQGIARTVAAFLALPES